MKTIILFLCLSCPLAVTNIAVASTAQTPEVSQDSEGFNYGFSLSGHALRMAEGQSHSDDELGLGFTAVAWLMSPESAHWQVSYSNAKIGEVTRVHRLFISRVFMPRTPGQRPFGYLSVGVGANGTVFDGSNTSVVRHGDHLFVQQDVDEPYHWDMPLNTRGGVVIPISQRFGFDANADVTVVPAGLTRSDDFELRLMGGASIGVILLL